MQDSWEQSIILRKTKNNFQVLPPVQSFINQEHFINTENLGLEKDLALYIGEDNSPLPLTEDREGYHGQRHFDYWLSGLEEFLKITTLYKKYVPEDQSDAKILDFGCASGRVLRHFATQSKYECWGCDINENHVQWCNDYLPNKVKVFQNTSLPHLQIPDGFFDLSYCLSVFTHIEEFETSWLCEFKRIMKPNGIAYVTIHDETSWKNMPKDWGVGHAVINHPDFEQKWIEEGFPNEKFVSRWINSQSYSSNVFYKLSYIHRVWSKFFKILEVIPMGSNYQTVLILQNSVG